MSADALDAGSRRLRCILLLFVGVAPLGWAVAWAVFHSVPGQDWVVFHTAAALVHSGDLRTLADPVAFTDLLNWTHRAWFPQPLLFHPWVYPPVTLLLASAFGGLPYLASLAAFLAGGIIALLAALLAWQPGRGGWGLAALVLLCPASAAAVGAGQLSFLVAACLLAGTAWLPTRPFLAGLTLSLLCLKPQFAMLVPVALLAGRHWRTIAGGLAGGTLLVLASLDLVGLRGWGAWLRLATGADPALPTLVGAVRLYDQSVFTCLRMLGVSPSLAGFGQIAAWLVASVVVWLAFARPLPPRRRLVVLLCASVFGAPHVGSYDAVLAAIAALFVLLDEPVSGAQSWLAAGVWIGTLFAPPALVAVLGIAALTKAAALVPLLTAGLMLCAARSTRSPGVYSPPPAVVLASRRTRPHRD